MDGCPAIHAWAGLKEELGALLHRVCRACHSVPYGAAGLEYFVIVATLHDCMAVSAGSLGPDKARKAVQSRGRRASWIHVEGKDPTGKVLSPKKWMSSNSLSM